MSSSQYLIDTHILLWNLNDDKRLRQLHLELLAGSTNKFLSIASIWEIAIKISVGKLSVPADFMDYINDSDLTMLPIAVEHAMAVKELPQHHRDPFDRMLIAQAQQENLTIITIDKNIPLYEVNTI